MASDATRLAVCVRCGAEWAIPRNQDELADVDDVFVWGLCPEHGSVTLAPPKSEEPRDGL